MEVPMSATSTPHLALPFVAAGQAQKHVTVNEGLDRLDALVQLSVLDRDSTSPPPNPAEGDRYICPAGGSGAFAARQGQIALFRDGAWRFLEPKAGWIAWAADEGRLLVHTGAGWEAAVGARVDRLGVNAEAGGTDRLAVSGPSTLLTHAGAGHQLKLNKSAAADTASLLLQTGFSGRAEIGLAGDDDVRLKVSADGLVWRDAFVAERASGRVRFPGGGVREQLSQPRSFFVRPDGSDTNNGLANTAAGAFATIQRAFAAAQALDFGLHAVEIRLAPGSYAGAILVGAIPGTGSLTLRGDGGTPGAVTIQGTGHALALDAGARLTVRNLRVQSTGGSGLCAENGSVLRFADVEFGPCASAHILAALAEFQAIGPYRIAGSAPYHVVAQTRSIIRLAFVQVTLVGTPAFSGSFVFALSQAIVEAYSCTFIGAATGQRHYAGVAAVIYTGTANPAFFPGNAPGVIDAASFAIFN
jgi:hypothetical protein